MRPCNSCPRRKYFSSVKFGSQDKVSVLFSWWSPESTEECWPPWCSLSWKIVAIIGKPLARNWSPPAYPIRHCSVVSIKRASCPCCCFSRIAAGTWRCGREPINMIVKSEAQIYLSCGQTSSQELSGLHRSGHKSQLFYTKSPFLFSFLWISWPQWGSLRCCEWDSEDSWRQSCYRLLSAIWGESSDSEYCRCKDK